MINNFSNSAVQLLNNRATLAKRIGTNEMDVAADI